MSAQQELVKTKKKRTRRNFAKELADIEAYCRAHIEVLGETPNATDRYLEGKAIAFRQVIAKIEGLSK